MSSVSKLQKKIYEMTKGLFATWLPDDHLDVGDYGNLEKGRFLRDGNLKKKSVLFEEQIISSDKRVFRYSDGAKIKSAAAAHGSAAAGFGDAAGEIEFSKEGGFIYHFHDATQIRIESRDDFFRSLLEAIISGQIMWQDGYVVIDELRDCARYWIMVSEMSSGLVKLKASSKVTEDANLANLGGNVSTSVEFGSILDYSNGERGRPLYHAVKPVFGGATGGEGFQAMLKYFWSFFENRHPKPNEIDITKYQSSDDTYLIRPTSSNATEEIFTVRFESATIEDLLSGSAQASVSEDIDNLHVDTVNLQQFGAQKYEAGH
ncbi:hypothetical protein HCG46_21885 [Labrenzia sp. PO1]|uniref:hypothetical protein n=1 Tax=Labrenzia sp. PO1 TaxID=2720390 RepID=UPI0014476C85|nr:hypothetical protein [Labrenzia sp. PO1]NKI60935.1 hypothetical protein [Labrenzia sp. PO1]